MDWREEIGSLAWLKYGPLILSKRGGPIERLTAREVMLANGTTEHEVYATLRDGLIPEATPQASPLFIGKSHGSGTARSKRVATHIAISEALERWAAMSIQAPDGERDSHGFAAFPGWSDRSPRESARLEVIERFCLADALLGNRPFQRVGAAYGKDIEFLRAASPDEIFVLMGRYRDPDVGWSYGFSARRTLEAAQRQVAVEIQRNLRNLRRACELGVTPGASTHPYETKLLAFSRGEKAEQTGDLFARAAGGYESAPVPSFSIDHSVRGPWSKWTHVWRCALDEEVTREALTNPNVCLF